MKKYIVFTIILLVSFTLSGCKDKEKTVLDCMGDEVLSEKEMICIKLDDTPTTPLQLSGLLESLVSDYDEMLENGEYEYTQFHYLDVVDREDFYMPPEKVKYSPESDLKGIEFYVNWRSTWGFIQFSNAFLKDFIECEGLVENVFCEYSEYYSFRYNVVGTKITIEVFDNTDQINIDLGEIVDKTYLKFVIDYKAGNKIVSFFYKTDSSYANSEVIKEYYYEENVQYWSIGTDSWLTDGDENLSHIGYMMEHISFETNESIKFSTYEHYGTSNGYLLEVIDYNHNISYAFNENSVNDGIIKLEFFDDDGPIFIYDNVFSALELTYNMLFMDGWDQISLEGFTPKYLNNGEEIAIEYRDIRSIYRSDYAPLITVRFEDEFNENMVNGGFIGLDFSGVTYQEVIDKINTLESGEYLEILTEYGLSADVNSSMENFGGNIQENLGEFDLINPIS